MEHHSLILRFIMAVVASSVIVAVPRLADAQIGLERKIVLQQDAAIPGYEIVVAEVSMAVGGREGRHSHSGTLVGYILEGELTLELEGQPAKIVKAGETVLIEPFQVHEGFNKGSVPIKGLITFIVKKGKPLTTPAQ